MNVCTVSHRRHNPIYFVESLAMVLVFLVSLPVHAQVAGGTLSGIVTDPVPPQLEVEKAFFR